MDILNIVPEEVSFIIHSLIDHGYEAYMVGGCVRDILMGATPKDFDITTSATPDAVKKIFAHTYDTGIKHGTVTVLRNNLHFEVTTFRIDGDYKDNRRPEQVFFTDNLMEDLFRRDFTMNAIAYNEAMAFIDPFGGRIDIEKKIIRAVGDPSKRFQEDALRLLRCVRFSAQLNFDVEMDTYEALLENAHLIKNISIERVRDELLKLFLTNNTEKFYLLLESQVLKHIHIKFSGYFEQHIVTLCRLLNGCREDLIIRLTLLSCYMEKNDCIELLKYLRLDNQTIKEVSTLVGYFNTELSDDFYDIRKTISILTIDSFQKLLYIKNRAALTEENHIQSALIAAVNKKVKSIIDHNHPVKLGQLKITGDDLISLGFTKGKAIGNTLSYLFDCVLKDPQLNSYDELIKLLPYRQ